MSTSSPMLAAMTLSTLLLAACGGGGGGEDASGAAASPKTPAAARSAFPLLAAYTARLMAGSFDNFTVSGTCSGSAQISNGPAQAADFEGTAGYSVTETDNVNLTNCMSAGSVSRSTEFFTTGYILLGGLTPHVDYTKVVNLPATLPATVKVGDGGTYATLNVYADSSKATLTGQLKRDYLIEADGSSTVIVAMISREYNNAGVLQYIEQDRYRLAADGSLTMLSIDAQCATGCTTHLIFTRI